MGDDVMRIEAKATVVLTMAILINGCVGAARADEVLSAPSAATTPSGDGCGTSQGGRDVDCRPTANDGPVAPANSENSNPELQRGDQPRAATAAEARGFAMGVLAVLR